MVDIGCKAAIEGLGIAVAAPAQKSPKVSWRQDAEVDLKGGGTMPHGAVYGASGAIPGQVSRCCVSGHSWSNCPLVWQYRL